MTHVCFECWRQLHEPLDTEAILTQTDFANTKKRRPRLESMAAEGKAIELDIHEWSMILLALCGASAKEKSVRNNQLETATMIANQLADALGIAPPSWQSR